MATTKYADLSCHVEPSGIIKYSEKLVTDEYSLTASAETDKHGNIVKGEWTLIDDKGVDLSITYPDGQISGRNAPKSIDFQEGPRDDRGEFLMRKIQNCKTASNMNLF